MSDAWVLLRRAAGDVTCCRLSAGPGGAEPSLGAGGERNCAAGEVLFRAAGDKFRCEAWIVFI